VSGGVSESLEAQLGALGVAPEARSRLARYLELLLEHNANVNLTGARDVEALLAHVVDSLAIARFVRDPLVDIGSGGGFPAIVLSIVTGCAVTLIEATHKKARFLDLVVAELSLAGQVIAERAEVAAHDPALRERFASATARAVASAPAVLELTLPFLALGGVAVLQRGRMEYRELTAAHDAALMLGGGLVEEHAIDETHRVLLVPKRRPTPERFPRRVGLPERRPLAGQSSTERSAP
jgi:16S rRNA (guanine527-N7)-methyltransferase